MSQYEALVVDERNDEHHHHGIIQQPSSSPLSSRRRAVYGMFIVIGIAISWVGSTQASESSFKGNNTSFKAPFFGMWFSTCWFVIAFPITTLFRVVFSCGSTSVSQIYHTASSQVLGTRSGVDGKSVRVVNMFDVVKVAVPFLVLWGGANYSYSRALMTTSASDVTAVFSATPAVVYVLSIVLLDHQLQWLPVIAVVATVGGVIMVACSERVKGIPPIGLVLTLCASVCAALYKVWLKRSLGDAGATTISLLLTTIAVLNAVVLWPVWFLLNRFDVETFVFAEVPWMDVCISSALGLTFNFLINFGILFTYPLFISLGTVLGIPLNLIFDKIFRGTDSPPLKVGGCGLIIIGFIMLAVQMTPRKRTRTRTVTVVGREHNDINN
eukprot:m.170273 g.170273  ORF g.170273 m.170273 type:complete len:383 (-) comp31606_c0_seq2:125-1273(-)